MEDLAERFADSFKTELIADRAWRTRSQLEPAIVEYVNWFNSARLHEALGDRPPKRVRTNGTRSTDGARTRRLRRPDTCMKIGNHATRSPRNPARPTACGLRERRR
jgi:hypothetical protein